MRNLAKMLLLTGALGAGIALGGCSSSSDAAKAALNPDPPDRMYAIADAFMAKGKWEDAAKKFEDLDRDHPYAPEARRATAKPSYAH